MNFTKIIIILLAIILICIIFSIYCCLIVSKETDERIDKVLEKYLIEEYEKNSIIELERKIKSGNLSPLESYCYYMVLIKLKKKLKKRTCQF